MRFGAFASALLVLALCCCSGPDPEHFWDGYDFSSTDGLDPIDEAGDRFVRYATLLNRVDTTRAGACIRDFLDSAAADTVSYYVYSDMFVEAFHHRKSPCYNNDLFRIYLSKAVEDGIATEYERWDERALLHKTYQNLPGSIAADGLLLPVDGDPATVLEMAAASPRTIIYLIGQAGCRSCADKMKELEKKTARSTQLIGVVAGNRRGEAFWLQDNLGERWTVALAGESFLRDWDFSFAPVIYVLDRSGKIKSIK